MAKTTKRIWVEDYCKQFPDLKDYTLAKKVFKELEGAFVSVESARSMVRTIRGHHGEKNRELSADKSLHKPITYDTTNQKPEAINTGARILVLDIETAPINAFVWAAWKQNVNSQQIISDWFMLTWAAKWLFEDTVYSGAVTPKEARQQNDKRIVASLWHLLNEADIVIAHNGVDFDIPKINTRFLKHGFLPPSPYVVIDTLKHVRKQFAITHNKLDYVNQFLNLPRKISHDGFEMWVACYKGDKEALDKMLDYNVGDVRILEDTYLRIRPWIKPHPNVGLHILDETQSRCPSCGSNHLKEDGRYHTNANVYAAIRCENCGSMSRKRITEINIKQRRHLTLSIPR